MEGSSTETRPGGGPEDLPESGGLGAEVHGDSRSEARGQDDLGNASEQVQQGQQQRAAFGAVLVGESAEDGKKEADADVTAAAPRPRKATVLETHGYAVGETVGSGSYATVKVAKSERHDCNVAVKIVSKVQAPVDYLRKFLPREIEVVKGLRHPNLIRFLQAIETTHRVYIVMEYAANGSMLDVIRRESHIDEHRGRRWFGQLADAVQYCHERGIVHRDIKCENLLMDVDLNVKLSDFGFARILGAYRGESSSPGPQLSDTFCGSYAYASPEILSGIPYQPQLADVWSMGVVLYAIVFGRLPFDDSNLGKLLRQVQGPVRFPREPGASRACKSLIVRILAPAPLRPRLAAIRVDPWLLAAPTTPALPAPRAAPAIESSEAPSPGVVSSPHQ